MSNPKIITDNIKEGFSYKTAFWVFLIGMLLYRLFYIAFAPLQLTPEEAYYWCYSQHPALSYFDHPPMVAWIIWFFTKIFGNTEFAIRIGAVLMASGMTYFIYLIATKLFDEKAGFFSAIIINLAFVFNIYATGITPDTPLFFFWTVSLYYYLKAWEKNNIKDWILAGILTGCALLSKYTAIFLPFSMGIFLITEKEKKAKWKKYILSVVIAAIIFSPVIIWNVQNEFASFAFQSTERAKTAISFSIEKILGNFFGGIGFQALFLSLFLFFAMVSCLWKESQKKEKSFPQRYLLEMSLPTLIFFLLISIITWVKTNWPTPGYIAALILLGACFSKNINSLKKKKAALSYTIITLLFALFLNGLAMIQPIYPQILPPLSKANTMTGWKKLTQYVKETQHSMPEPENTFIVGHGYQIASELNFYGFRKTKVYSSNIFNERALAYDFWQNKKEIKKLAGKDAILVIGKFEDFNPKKINSFFKNYKEIEPLNIEIAGVKIRKFRIFKCYDYLH